MVLELYKMNMTNPTRMASAFPKVLTETPTIPMIAARIGAPTQRVVIKLPFFENSHESKETASKMMKAISKINAFVQI